MVFLAIWWAWNQYTWFASSFDNNSVRFRLATLWQMVGALVIAAGVDSAGIVQVIIRDQLAGFSTPDGATRKARTAINFRTSTSSLAQSIVDNPEAGEIRNLPGILVLSGGVIIQAEGSMVGAVGVAGAPGGEMDEKCANAGVEAIQETLDFL